MEEPNADKNKLYRVIIKIVMNMLSCNEKNNPIACYRRSKSSYFSGTLVSCGPGRVNTYCKVM